MKKNTKDDLIRLVIIDDNKFIRRGIEFLLNSKPDFNIIGSFENCEDAINSNLETKANLMLMDIKLPGISGIEGVKYFKEKYPHIICLMYTAYEDDENIFNAIKAGAIGFIGKKSEAKQLIDSLRKTAAGGSPITPGVASRLLNYFTKYKSIGSDTDSLITEEEKKVLLLISQGKSFSGTAAELNLPGNNIPFIIRDIYLKIQQENFIDKKVKSGA